MLLFISMHYIQYECCQSTHFEGTFSDLHSSFSICIWTLNPRLQNYFWQKKLTFPHPKNSILVSKDQKFCVVKYVYLLFCNIKECGSIFASIRGGNFLNLPTVAWIEHPLDSSVFNPARIIWKNPHRLNFVTTCMCKKCLCRIDQI